MIQFIELAGEIMSNPFWLTDAQMAWLWPLFPKRNDPCGSDTLPPLTVLPRKQALSRNLSLLMDADPTFLAMSGMNFDGIFATSCGGQTPPDLP